MANSSSGRAIGLLWLYTGLRAAVFGVMFGLLWLLDVRGLLGALIALVLSVPLSIVLLARPRRKLAESLEQHTEARRQREDVLRRRLRGEDDADRADTDDDSATRSDTAGPGRAGDDRADTLIDVSRDARDGGAGAAGPTR